MSTPGGRGFAFQMLVVFFLLVVGVVIVLGNWLLESAAAKIAGLVALLGLVFLIGPRITAKAPGEENRPD